MDRVSILSLIISRESIMILPIRMMASGGLPSFRRFSSASGEGVQRISAMESVTMRLISSGMVRSKERRPASRWAVLIPSLAAARVAAAVELTSPTTMVRSGRVSRSIFSYSIMTLPVCSACVPLPTLRWMWGSGMFSSLKNTSDKFRS